MGKAQAGLLWLLRSIWQAKAKITREEIEKAADELEKEGIFFDEDEPSEDAQTLKPPKP